MGPAKRSFIIAAHKAPLNANFTLNDLPGSAGRMDILARFVTSSLCISHGLRTDVDVYLVVQNQLTIRISGSRVKRLNPDERSTGALIKKALECYEANRARLHDANSEIESTPGIYVSLRSLSDVISILTHDSVRVYLLDEGGADIRNTTLTEPLGFVLSDHQNFSEEEFKTLKILDSISLGPIVLQADQCPPIVHNELDRHSHHT